MLTLRTHDGDHPTFDKFTQNLFFWFALPTWLRAQFDSHGNSLQFMAIHSTTLPRTVACWCHVARFAWSHESWSRVWVRHPCGPRVCPL